MKKFLWVALAALVLTGCPSRPPEPTAPVTVEPQPQPEPQPEPLPPTTEPVPQPPKIQQLDWLGSVQPLVNQMLKADGVTPGSVLLLDSVKKQYQWLIEHRQRHFGAAPGFGIQQDLCRRAGSAVGERQTDAGPVGGR
ncbi:Lipoprotein activator of PBP from the outer membrane B [Serratia fonticola]|uniref:Type IV secretion system putative lipoprotein virB7 n=1 Tax=Serratia fonticola TaxID=47917 RepID=A0A4U9VUJ4_SERFO|nr:Lipoprotein activator of PBP from the outer membrane B [Serratia fonticola]